MRKHLGWTQNRLAKESGISQSMIHKIERRRINPSYETIRKLHNVLLYACRSSFQKKKSGKTARDVLKEKERKGILGVISVSINETVETALKIMRENDFSQMPVTDGKEQNRDNYMGSITFTQLVDPDILKEKNKKLADIELGRKFPVVDLETPISIIVNYLKQIGEGGAVLVEDKKTHKIVGLINAYDLIEIINSEENQSFNSSVSISMRYKMF